MVSGKKDKPTHGSDSACFKWGETTDDKKSRKGKVNLGRKEQAEEMREEGEPFMGEVKEKKGKRRHRPVRW
jgi:hypothetical protein